MIYWAVMFSRSCLNIYVFPRTFYEDICTFKSSFLSALIHRTSCSSVHSPLLVPLQVHRSELTIKECIRKVEAYNRMDPSRAKKQQKQLHRIFKTSTYAK